MSEHDEQVALMQWANTRAGALPELAYLFAVPNGARRTKRERGIKLGEGLKAGVPDLFLPAPRGHWHGLWLELKYGAGDVTENQARWQAWLKSQGYAAEVCYSWQDAAELIEMYLDVPENQRTEFFR